MYLFLVRHFNDIDHITPIVWKLKKDDHPVAVYCMNARYDIGKDYRLQFLKDRGVAVDYLHNAFEPPQSRLHHFMQSLIQKSFAVQRRHGSLDQKPSQMGARLIGKSAGLMGSLLYKLTRRIYYDQAWAQVILEQLKARVICFDYIMPSLYVVDAFLKAAGQMRIPTLALPHGVQLYTNEITKPKSTDARRFAKFNRFDYIIAPNQLRKEILVRSGVAEEKIVVLGSARYCREWLEQNNKIVPKVMAADGNGSAKLKVVLMPSKPQCRMDIARLVETCGILADLSSIEAMIKPHTRARGNKNIFDDISLTDASHVLSAELFDWADVFLVVGSSVITEALMRGKPALYLKYLHANTTLFEELGACWTIQNEDELKNALLSLQTDKAGVPYREENVTKFISEVVLGGNDGGDVLNTYEQFIVNCAWGERSIQTD
jgi:hypothetical protein